MPKCAIKKKKKKNLQEMEKVTESKSLEKVPRLQEVLEELKSSASLSGFFLDILTK